MEDGQADLANFRCRPDTRLSAGENRDSDRSSQSMNTKDHVIYGVAHGSICVPKAL